ncbi:MAG TPA: glycoside hydrolase family 38 C-terminal domain-containing protein [Ignavibacteriaceae bacterium]|nr:glycoside hydrolase family 38 C-terminal domain-containing protein [Ignavibacteriaceae bacterium]
MKDKVFHVISNTHWDREWRYPFQRNRKMLVDMIDKVIDILLNEPEYKAFHLDSQSIVLDDYLAIKPYQKDIIKKLVEEKRLLIGPWYILPEEFQVGGENLIRNLLLGHKVCNQMGGVSKIGYSPFSWGQISQLPQIYKGFGIDVIMFYRGVNSLDSNKSEFIWEGADGTKAITSRFSTMPRYNFYFYIYRKVIHNEDFSDVEYKWERGGLPFHIVDANKKEDYSIIKPQDTYYKENIKPSVERIINDQVNDFSTEHIIWMEGHDSSGPNIKTVQIIKDIKEAFPNLNVVHSTLEDYSKALEKSVDESKLAIVKGERRSAQFDNRSGNMYGYTTSARMDIKLKNFEAEKHLQYYAEPLNSLAEILGLDTNDEYLNIAWNYLIQNSAHDSIGGCSLDEIHEDMFFRYQQVIEISDAVTERALKFLVSKINTSNFILENNQPKIFLHVFNTLGFSRSRAAEVFIDIPEEYDKGSIKILDINFNEVPVQIFSKYKKESIIEQLIDRPMYFNMVRYKCILDIQNIPSIGYQTFNVIPGKSIKKEKGFTYQQNGFHFLENNYLKIQINNDGSLDLLNKETGYTFKNICYLFSEGEEGHAWVHKPVGPIMTSLNSKAIIKRIFDGPVESKVSIKYNLKVPANLLERQKNKPKFVKIPIELQLGLSKCSKYFTLKIKLNNTSESHRLRLMLPTGLRNTFSFGEGQFDVVKRSTERIDSSDWIEQPMYDYPMHHFVDVNNNLEGIAVFANGLKEYEVLDDENKTLGITLIRGFNYVIQPASKEDYSFKKGSHVLGEYEFNIAIMPHKGSFDNEVLTESYNFTYPFTSVQSGENKNNLNLNESFFKIEPEQLILSSIKKGEGKEGWVLRFFNPTEKNLSGIITLPKFVTNVRRVTLEEVFVENLVLKNDKVHLEVPPKKIITLKVM